MEKAEIFNFPTVIGSGGRGQSLHNEILIGAKPFKLSLPLDRRKLARPKRPGKLVELSLEVSGIILFF